jgi:hypothetical protein
LQNSDSHTEKIGVRDHALKFAIILVNEFFDRLNETLRKNG